MRKSLAIVLAAVLLAGCPAKKNAVVVPDAPPIEIPEKCVTNRYVYTADCEKTADGFHYLCQNVLIASACVDGSAYRLTK
jgi:hypothetical protein